MKIKAITQQKSVLYPAAVAVSAVLSACQQQPQPTGGAPLPPPGMVLPTNVDAQKPGDTQIDPSGIDTQRLPGRKPAP